MISSLLLLISFNLSAAVDWQSASQEVVQSIDKMLIKVAPFKGKLNADLEPFYQDLDEITQDRVDYPYIAKIVMGKYYRKATEQQKLDFQVAFKRTLLKTYGKALVSFDIKGYELLKSRRLSPKPNKQKVVIKVTSTTGDTYSLINYLVYKENKWKLVNIVLDGFNLRVTFKNQFGSIAQKNRGEMDLTIQKWSDSMSKSK
ncbi:MAG: ABC transporter substrate-binding protein [Oceanospirillaceae bacterium]